MGREDGAGQAWPGLAQSGRRRKTTLCQPEPFAALFGRPTTSCATTVLVFFTAENAEGYEAARPACECDGTHVPRTHRTSYVAGGQRRKYTTQVSGAVLQKRNEGR